MPKRAASVVQYGRVGKRDDSYVRKIKTLYAWRKKTKKKKKRLAEGVAEDLKERGLGCEEEKDQIVRDVITKAIDHT